jgi:hypothetical protein
MVIFAVTRPKNEAASPANGPQARPTTIAPAKSQENAGIETATNKGVESFGFNGDCVPAKAASRFPRRAQRASALVHTAVHQIGKTSANEPDVFSRNTTQAMMAKYARKLRNQRQILDFRSITSLLTTAAQSEE